MDGFKKFLVIEFVVFAIIVLIGLAAGLLYEQLRSSSQGYFTSSIIGISGSYLGYSLVFYLLYSANLQWHAMPIRFIGAVLGAVLVLWACRAIAAGA